MSLADFIVRWRNLTGETPAIMLDSRSEMIALLVESVPAAPPYPDDAQVRWIAFPPAKNSIGKRG